MAFLSVGFLFVVILVIGLSTATFVALVLYSVLSLVIKKYGSTGCGRFKMAACTQGIGESEECTKLTGYIPLLFYC